MRIFILCTSLCFSFLSFGKIKSIYQPKTGQNLKIQDLLELLPPHGYIVLGEYHNHQPIQNAQAHIIHKKILREQLFGNFTVAWEFLNHTDQNHTQKTFDLYSANLISVADFLAQTAGAKNLTYAPIMDVTKNLHGALKGINLPRNLKQQVIQGGIRAIDAKYIPTSHYVGGARYKARFTAAMGGHIPAAKLDRYFLAQCLTDSVMAFQTSTKAQTDLNFVVAGSFHTDFGDGTVARMKKLTKLPVITLKFASESLNTQEELRRFKNYDPDYGFFADFLVITD